MIGIRDAGGLEDGFILIAVTQAEIGTLIEGLNKLSEAIPKLAIPVGDVAAGHAEVAGIEQLAELVDLVPPVVEPPAIADPPRPRRSRSSYRCRKEKPAKESPKTPAKESLVGKLAAIVDGYEQITVIDAAALLKESTGYDNKKQVGIWLASAKRAGVKMFDRVERGVYRLADPTPF